MSTDKPQTLQHLLELIAVPVILLQKNRVLLANAPALDLFGRPLDALQGVALLELISVDTSPDQPAGTAAYFESDSSDKPLPEHLHIQVPNGHNWIGTYWVFRPAPEFGDGLILATIARTDVFQQTIPFGAPPQPSPLEHELHFRQLAENSPDTIFILNLLTERIIYMNANDLLGYPLDVVESIRIWDNLHPDDIERITRHWQTIDRKQRPTAVVEYRLKSTTGTYEWLQSRERVIEYTPDGRPLLLLVLLTNVSGRKEYETALAEYNRELEIINQIMASLSQSLDVRTISNQFLEHLQRLVPFISGSVSILKGDDLQFVALYGVPEEFGKTELATLLMRKDRINNILHSGQWDIIPDVLKDAEWVHLNERQTIRCWLGVPLMYHNEAIGLLTLDHETPDFYTRDHADQVNALAHQLGIALINSRLYEQARHESEERKHALASLYASLARIDAMYQVVRLLLTSDTLHEILYDALTIVSQAFDVPQLFLIAFDPDTGALTHRSQIGLTASHNLWRDFWQITGQQTASHSQMPPHDLDWQAANRVELDDGRVAFAAPVNKRGVLAAIIPADAVFESEDRFVLVTLANQFSIAIRNNLLDQRLRQYATHLEIEVAERTSELVLEQRRLQAIFDATGEGVLYLEDFRFQYVNPAFCRMLGYRADELVGQSLSLVYPEMIDPDTHAPTALMKRLLSARVLRIDTRLIGKDDHQFDARLTFTLVGDHDTHPARVVAVVRDISDEIALQRQRARFITNAAHELRTPLTSLGLRVHMLQKQPARLDEHLKHLERINTNLTRMVEELLDLSRFENDAIILERDWHNLQSIIRTAASIQKPFMERESVHLDVRIAVNSIQVYVDHGRMVQAVEKLLINALNYSEPDMTIQLEVQMRLVGDQQEAQIIVTDEGNGIDSELLPDQVFEAFSRPRLGNQFETGMGLALARQIVTLHGGLISAENRIQGGSRLTITLPAR